MPWVGVQRTGTAGQPSLFRLFLSVEARRDALIYAVHQPGQGLVCRFEHDLILENVVEIDVPSAKVVESGDRSTAVDHRHEFLLV
jgi:hypothetical protein